MAAASPPAAGAAARRQPRHDQRAHAEPADGGDDRRRDERDDPGRARAGRGPAPRARPGRSSAPVRPSSAQPQPGEQRRAARRRRSSPPSGRRRRRRRRARNQPSSAASSAGSSSVPTSSRTAQSGSTLRIVTIPSGPAGEGGRARRALRVDRPGLVDRGDRAQQAAAERAQPRARDRLRRARGRSSPVRADRDRGQARRRRPRPARRASAAARGGSTGRRRARRPGSGETSARSADSTVRCSASGAGVAVRRPRHHPRLADPLAGHVAEHEHGVDGTGARSRPLRAPTRARPRSRWWRPRSRRARASCAARAGGRGARARAAPPSRTARRGPGARARRATATTTIRRLDRPGRTPTTVSRSAPSHSVRRARDLEGGPARAALALPERRPRRGRPAARRPSEPAARSGNVRASSLSELRCGRAPSPNADAGVERVGAQPRRRRGRPVRERERRDEHGDQRGQEGGPVDPNVEHRIYGTWRFPRLSSASEGHGRPSPAHPARRRRAADPDAAVVPAAAGRLRRRAGVRRPRGAHPLLRADLRPRRARRDDAAHGRPRGVPPAARPLLGPDHHAHGQVRGDRQGPRARARRRRLHHQAVLDARVPLAREGGAAALRHGPGRRGRRARRSRCSACGSTRPSAP